MEKRKVFSPLFTIVSSCNLDFFIYHVLVVNTAVCPDPGEPINGERLQDNFQDGKTVTFKCNKNYDLVGNATIRCGGGEWSSDAPECKGYKTVTHNNR